MSNRHLLFCVLLVSLGMLAGCGSGGGGATGTLQVKITDAPFPVGELDAAVITVVSISARGDSGWVDIKTDDTTPVDIDLYQLTAGLAEELALVTVPTGAYDEVRLVISKAELTFTLDGGAPITQDFVVPSGASSGLKVKIDPPILVAEDQTAELLLDVDLSASFHLAGEGGEPTMADLVDAKAIFHPVIRAINLAETALLVGLVVDTTDPTLPLPLGHVEVSVFDAGTDLSTDPAPSATAATFSTPDGMAAAFGSYALALQPGSYDVYLRLQVDPVDPTASSPYLQVRSALELVAGDVRTEDLSPTP